MVWCLLLSWNVVCACVIKGAKSSVKWEGIWTSASFSNALPYRVYQKTAPTKGNLIALNFLDISLFWIIISIETTPVTVSATHPWLPHKIQFEMLVWRLMENNLNFRLTWMNSSDFKHSSSSKTFDGCYFIHKLLQESHFFLQLLYPCFVLCRRSFLMLYGSLLSNKSFRLFSFLFATRILFSGNNPFKIYSG